MRTELLAGLLKIGAGVAAVAFVTKRAGERLRLSRAKHRSLAGHVRMGKRIAGLIPFYEFDREAFFRADGAPLDIAAAERRPSRASPPSTAPASC